MADALLTVSNLETYYGPIMAIRGVSFTVPERAVVTILGANGAGKTTILKTVSGAMDPQKGTVTFAGREIQGRDPDEVARLGISHVPEGREVFPLLSVRENLMMGAYARRDASGVAEDLDLVYGYFPVLKDRTTQRTGQLSGGEQQMLAISRALMARPRMMLLDEPSLGLARRLVKEIFEIIARINRERGVTVLLVEQNANMALHLADYGYVQGHVRVLLHQEHGDAALAVDPGDDLEDLLHEPARQAQRRLVEQHHARPRHQRAADRQHLLLAPRELAGALTRAILQDREVAVDQVEVLGDTTGVPARVGAHHEIFADGEQREHLTALGDVTDAEPRHLVGIAALDLAPRERHRALLRVHGARHRLQDGGLPRAVGAQDGDDGPLGHGEADAADGHDRAVVGLEVADGEERFRHRDQPPR